MLFSEFRELADIHAEVIGGDRQNILQRNEGFESAVLGVGMVTCASQCESKYSFFFFF